MTFNTRQPSPARAHPRGMRLEVEELGERAEIVRGDIACAKACSGFTPHSCDINRTLDAHRNTVKGAERVTPHHCPFGVMRSRQCMIFIQIHERIEQ